MIYVFNSNTIKHVYIVTEIVDMRIMIMSSDVWLLIHCDQKLAARKKGVNSNTFNHVYIVKDRI